MFWIAEVKCRNTSVLIDGDLSTLRGGGGNLPDEAGMVRVGGDPQIGPPSPDLLAEHHVHQLRVVVVPLQGGG